MPYQAANMPASYPSYPLPGPSTAPPYPLHFTGDPSDIPSNSLTEGDCGSPSDGDEGVQYPTIAEFFTELMKTASTEHYFTDYTEAFRNNGYYRIDELADVGLTIGHMIEIIDHLKEGTAQVIKSKALDKVKKIRKGKGKK